QFPTRPIGPGQLTRIFTGAPLPAGADTVVRQEDTETAQPGEGGGRITVVTGRHARTNVRYRGEDIRKGEVVLGAGTPLGPAQLAQARARGADLVVTTAGVSVGEHDFVREVLTELVGEIKLWRIAMRPGAPVGFGLLGVKPWIGLPGNPVSAMVTFDLFVRPAVRRLLGHRLPFRRTVPVCVGEPIKLGPKLRHFLRADRKSVV